MLQSKSKEYWDYDNKLVKDEARLKFRRVMIIAA